MKLNNTIYVIIGAIIALVIGYTMIMDPFWKINEVSDDDYIVNIVVNTMIEENLIRDFVRFQDYVIVSNHNIEDVIITVQYEKEIVMLNELEIIEEYNKNHHGKLGEEAVYLEFVEYCYLTDQFVRVSLGLKHIENVNGSIEAIVFDGVDMTLEFDQDAWEITWIE